MKLLERISLVQFFLYECTDIPIVRNTGFFGPNGTGKTVLADAIQTVMLGADGHRLKYNAQADGKTRARNLRSYCLGVYDVSEKGRCRDTSNTYVSLVFRDETTGDVITAGVAASASIDSSESHVHALFLLPGVALSANDFVQRVNDRQSNVMPWKDVQHVLRQRVKDAGGDTERIFTTNREEFVRRLLVEYLAGPGEAPNVAQFRNAFQRSLQLQAIDDLSTALREYLIEPGTTNIREFKARADQFRKMSELVTRTRDQIERIGIVGAQYDKVRQLRSREACYEGLAATLNVEAIGERVASEEDRVEGFEKQIVTARDAKTRTEQELDDAKVAYESARDLQANDVEYKKRAAASGVLGERERVATQAAQTLQKEVQGMVSGLQGMARQPGMSADLETFEQAVTLASGVLEGLSRQEVPDSPTVQALALAMGRCAESGKRRVADLERTLEEQRRSLKVAKSTLDRVRSGLTALADPVAYLQLRLEEAGIKARPVCDVVEISDPVWQPVVEAYLGLNSQALLVPRDQLEAAVRVHRKLPAHLVAGAKLVSYKHLEPWRRRDGHRGRFAAELVRGDDPDAVAFLQGGLGPMTCVETEAELIAARNGFTPDGMISRNGAIERRALPPLLQIGRQDRAAAKFRAERDVRELGEAVDVAERSSKVLLAANAGLSFYASAEKTRERLEPAFIHLASLWRSAEEARDVQLSATSGDLAKLDALVRTRREAAEELERQVRHWVGELSGANARRESASAALLTHLSDLEKARERERSATKAPLYDANEADRLRVRIGERDPDADTATQVARCQQRAREAASQAGTAVADAAVALSKYLIDFGINADTGAEWEARASYCKSEHARLSGLTLAERVAEAEAALKAAEEIFRTDVVHALCNGFDAVERQIEALNMVLRQAPDFSNRERYRFRHKPVDQFRPLYDFVRRAREEGIEESLFSDAARLPAEFRELMEGDANSPLLQDTSPLSDYRRFFAYDIQIFRQDEPIGMLSKRFGPGSGGEHKVPLYVIFGAALAAAYGNLHGRNASGSVMLLDEAFDKVDSGNATAVVDYLNRLGLQLIMAGPETEQTKLSGFLHCYYDMSRDGSRVIRLEQTLVQDEARDLLRSDNPRYQPDLLEREIERLRALEAADVTLAKDP